MPGPTLIVQDDFGQTDNANAYIDEPYFKTYADNQGYDYTTPAYTDPQIQVAIIQGRTYMDTRWRYWGMRKQILQTTEWPRYNIIDVDRNPVNIIPDNVKRANAEYAWIYLTTGTLNPIPTRDETGAALQARTTQVGPVLESIRFSGVGSFKNPIYPIADGYLKSRGYVIATTALMRG